MSEAQRMLKTCLHKKIFRTEEFAKERAKEFTKKFGVKTRAYFCPICGWWHLTTKDKK